MKRLGLSTSRRAASWLLALLLLPACDRAESDPLMVFAAASLRDVMLEQAGEFGRATGLEASFNFAGSNALALQLEASPRSADVFLSADTFWMDHLLEADVVVPSSRVEFLSNRLVVVAGSDSSLAVGELSDLAAPGVRYLALGNPEAVPAGRYARSVLEGVAFESGSLWEAVEGRVAPSVDAPSVLALIKARRDTLGIVYSTDARGSAGTRTLLEIPRAATPPILYSAAVARQTRRPDEAAAFVAFLSSDAARRVFARHGFEVDLGAAGG